MLKRPSIKPSFPLAIALVSVLCAVLMVKFRYPHPNHFVNGNLRKVRTASLRKTTTKIGAPKETLSSQVVQPPTPTVSQELKEARRMGPIIEEKSKVPLVTLPQAALIKQPLPSIKELVASILSSETPTRKSPIPVKRVVTIQKKAPKQKIMPAIPIKEGNVPIAAPSEPEWVQSAFELSSEEDYIATDAPTPLDELAKHSFDEVSQSPSFNSDPRLASVHLDFGEDALTFLKNEPRYFVKEGTFEQITFDDLESELAKLSEQGALLEAPPIAPLPRVSWAELPIKPVEPTLEAPSERVSSQKEIYKEPHLVSLNERALSQQAKESVETTNPQREDSILPNQANPTEEETAEDEPTIVKMLHKHSLNSGPNYASLGDALVTSQRRVPESKFIPPVASQGVPAKSNVNTQTMDTQVETPEFHNTDGGMIYGRLLADNALAAWLEKNRGHVELHLDRVGSVDPQDTIYIMNYQFPGQGEKFQIDAKEMDGKYRLMARVYANSAVPIAQIPYSKPISAANYKETVQFHLKKDFVDPPANKEGFAQRERVLMTVTLFEGASADHHQAKAIKKGTVSVAGFPEWGIFHADQDGNIRIPQVPIHSEIVLQTQAEGFYDTRQVVPVFTTDVYAPVYLVQRDKVEVITQYFTKRKQVEGKAVLLGRLYDPKSRIPLAEQEVSLSFRKGQALYFDTLPDSNLKATKSSGLFGFFNIEPSFRSVLRQGSKHAHLLNIDEGMGYYVEMGRGGSRNLKALLTDPFAGHPVEAKVHLVGEEHLQVASNEKGQFSIPDIDLPPGVITLETETEGYTKTWHTIPWSTREPERVHTLYMIQNEMVMESAATIARAKREKNRGVVIGGAHTSFFRAGRKNVFVSLERLNGSKLPSEFGPFPLTNTKFDPKVPLVLTSQNPGFAFYNLPSGEYILKWGDTNKSTFRTHLVRVGIDRISVVVN